MRQVSQRELRNDNAELMRAVEAGESFTVTRRGVPVAKLVPITTVTDLPIARPARKSLDSLQAPRVRSQVATTEVLDDLREEP